jgi:hypothetical protein
MKELKKKLTEVGRKQRGFITPVDLRHLASPYAG